MGARGGELLAAEATHQFPERDRRCQSWASTSSPRWMAMEPRGLARLVGLEGPESLAWLAADPEADSTVLMGATTAPGPCAPWAA